MIPIVARYLAVSLLPLALAACGSNDDSNLDTLDNSIASADSNGADPALRAALQDQIMVDPTLGQKANGDAIRPPSQPYSAPIPASGVAANSNPPANGEELLHAPAPAGQCNECRTARQSRTLGGLAARQKNMGAACSQVEYSASWAERLPADLPLYPQANVTEAAGSTRGNCTLRIVSFSAPAPMQTLIDWYYTRAIRAGYTAEHKADGDEHVLGGTRDRDGGAYVLFLTPRADGGTDVDLVANNGA